MTNSTPIDGEIIPPRKRGKPPYQKGWTKPPEMTEEEAAQREAFARVVRIGKLEEEFTDDREPNDQERMVVRSMVFSGIDKDIIAGMLGLETSQLNYWFKKELDFGKHMMVADIAYGLATRARLGSDSASIYLLNTRGGPAFSVARATKEAEAAAEEEIASGGSAPQLTKSEKDLIIGKIMDIVKRAETPERSKEEVKK